MTKDKETHRTWNKMAKLYQDKFMDMDLYNDTYDAFLNQLTQILPKVLDIGCGPGNITKYLVQQNSDLRVTAIDVAPKMVELTKENNPTAQTFVLNANAISTLNTTFNGIIAGFCIPYLSQDDCNTFISDCHNLLESRGVFYLSFVEGSYQSSKYKSGLDGNRVYFYYHELGWIKKHLESNGFEILDLTYKFFKGKNNSEEPHTILMARKRV